MDLSKLSKIETPEEEAHQIAVSRAVDYLKGTTWMIVAAQESELVVPEDVVKARAEAISTLLSKP